ncbi:unnamed protein product, partial [Eruca vesicaria subsp. sativa]|nr:unnamed protein product [Eruca vesicaria subsp. sativa]
MGAIRDLTSHIWGNIGDDSNNSLVCSKKEKQQFVWLKRIFVSHRRPLLSPSLNHSKDELKESEKAKVIEKWRRITIELTISYFCNNKSLPLEQTNTEDLCPKKNLLSRRITNVLSLIQQIGLYTRFLQQKIGLDKLLILRQFIEVLIVGIRKSNKHLRSKHHLLFTLQKFQ